MSYYGNSHLGTPEVAFEKSGEVTWRAKGKAFGETVVSLNTIDNPLRFPGQYLDMESGLYYNYFRDYDPGVGRYVESDPIGLAAGLNTYAYVGGNSIQLIDPFGLSACYVLFPDYPIEYASGRTSTWLGGHAGVLGYSSSGATRYYEYGRYPPSASGVFGVKLTAEQGNIRRLGVPNLIIGPDGKPTPESLKALEKALSRRAGKDTKVEMSCDAGADEDKVYDHIEKLAKDKNRSPYSWSPFSPNQCRSFASGAVGAGK